MARLDIRTADRFFVFVPPGLDEQAISLVLLHREDRTAVVAEIAERWQAARARHAAALEQGEGVEGFSQRQRLYATVAELARSRRLSRFLYLAEKPA
jgi:hypothetical protein